MWKRVRVRMRVPSEDGYGGESECDGESECEGECECG